MGKIILTSIFICYIVMSKVKIKNQQESSGAERLQIPTYHLECSLGEGSWGLREKVVKSGKREEAKVEKGKC